MIFVDADELLLGCPSIFQEKLLIPVHAVAGGNHKKILKEGFRRYLNKFQKINSSYKDSLNQWLYGVSFALYDWNAGSIYETDNA